MPGKLTATPEGDKALSIARRFDAPPAAVFRAMTTTALMRQWMQNSHGPLTVLEGEAVLNGTHRFVWQMPAAGNAEMEMVATYFVIDPPHRITMRERWPQYDALESTVAIVLGPGEDGAATDMAMTVTFPSAAGRDQAIQTGMAAGMEETYANLDALLASGRVDAGPFAPPEGVTGAAGVVEGLLADVAPAKGPLPDPA